MKKQLRKRIGLKISSARRLHGLSQEAFAERAKVSRGFLSDIERGTKSISVDTLVDLCKAAKMSANQLLDSKETI